MSDHLYLFFTGPCSFGYAWLQLIMGLGITLLYMASIQLSTGYLTRLRRGFVQHAESAMGLCRRCYVAMGLCQCSSFLPEWRFRAL
jgi:hypothetical protein